MNLNSQNLLLREYKLKMLKKSCIHIKNANSQKLFVASFHSEPEIKVTIKLKYLELSSFFISARVFLITEHKNKMEVH